LGQMGRRGGHPPLRHGTRGRTSQLLLPALVPGTTIQDGPLAGARNSRTAASLPALPRRQPAPGACRRAAHAMASTGFNVRARKAAIALILARLEDPRLSDKAKLDLPHRHRPLCRHLRRRHRHRLRNRHRHPPQRHHRRPVRRRLPRCRRRRPRRPRPHRRRHRHRRRCLRRRSRCHPRRPRPRRRLARQLFRPATLPTTALSAGSPCNCHPSPPHPSAVVPSPPPPPPLHPFHRGRCAPSPSVPPPSLCACRGV
jgi:hypothetical protein